MRPQVDGGSEFMAEFEGGCARSDIPLAILSPPPPPEDLNSHIEFWNQCSATGPSPKSMPSLTATSTVKATSDHAAQSAW